MPSLIEVVFDASPSGRSAMATSPILLVQFEQPKACHTSFLEIQLVKFKNLLQRRASPLNFGCWTR
jgi:hypothetical protein